MPAYDIGLKKHLAAYRVDQLGIAAEGVWHRNGRSYAHILPVEFPELNVLETVRSSFWPYARAERITLHHDFHHLNSSQAFAFNLFFPFAGPNCPHSAILLNALGLAADEIDRCQFEAILDEQEGTNFDFSLMLRSGIRVGIEVKLSEQSFGSAKNDDRHRQKRDAIYVPRLARKVHTDALSDKHFFRKYQILRNVCYADAATGHRTLFVLPRENVRLARSLSRFMKDFLLTEIQPFVTVIYTEDLVNTLRLASGLPSEIRSHYDALVAKYNLTLGTAAERYGA
jgi:hypothetical protein